MGVGPGEGFDTMVGQEQELSSVVDGDELVGADDDLAEDDLDDVVDDVDDEDAEDDADEDDDDEDDDEEDDEDEDSDEAPESYVAVVTVPDERPRRRRAAARPAGPPAHED